MKDITPNPSIVHEYVNLPRGVAFASLQVLKRHDLSPVQEATLAVCPQRSSPSNVVDM